MFFKKNNAYCFKKLNLFAVVYLLITIDLLPIYSQSINSNLNKYTNIQSTLKPADTNSDLSKLVKSIINTYDEDSDQQLDKKELQNMLENPKILDAYVKILNKKHPNFFHETLDNQQQQQRMNDESDLDEKLKENDNLKSKKRQKLQEEFKKSEFKHIYSQLEMAVRTTTTLYNKNLKLNESNLIKKSDIAINKPTITTTRKISTPLFRTRLTETTTTLTFKKPTTFKVQTTKESSKQILERFFKSKNKGNDT